MQEFDGKEYERKIANTGVCKPAMENIGAILKSLDELHVELGVLEDVVNNLFVATEHFRINVPEIYETHDLQDKSPDSKVKSIIEAAIEKTKKSTSQIKGLIRQIQ